MVKKIVQIILSTLLLTGVLFSIIVAVSIGPDLLGMDVEPFFGAIRAHIPTAFVSYFTTVAVFGSLVYLALATIHCLTISIRAFRRGHASYGVELKKRQRELWFNLGIGLFIVVLGFLYPMDI